MSENSPIDPAPQDQFVTVDGIRICYQLIRAPQSSGMPVIFTHGGGPGSSSWNNFLYNARAFSQTFDCIFVDLPGYGGSEFSPVQGPVFSWYADKFIKFMNELKVERAHLVNQSFGGSTAIKVASLAPERIASLVISGARPIIGGIFGPVIATRARQAVEAYYGNSGPSEEKMRTLIADLEFFDQTKVSDLNVRMRYEASIRPAARKFLSDPKLRGTPESLLEVFRYVKAKTLIVHGGYDAFTSIDVPLLMLNQFEHARLHAINRAGHHVQTECHREYNDVVIPFLA